MRFDRDSIGDIELQDSQLNNPRYSGGSQHGFFFYSLGGGKKRFLVEEVLELFSTDTSETFLQNLCFSMLLENELFSNGVEGNPDTGIGYPWDPIFFIRLYIGAAKVCACISELLSFPVTLCQIASGAFWMGKVRTQPASLFQSWQIRAVRFLRVRKANVKSWCLCRLIIPPVISRYLCPPKIPKWPTSRTKSHDIILGPW